MYIHICILLCILLPPYFTITMAMGCGQRKKVRNRSQTARYYLLSVIYYYFNVKGYVV